MAGAIFIVMVKYGVRPTSYARNSRFEDVSGSLRISLPERNAGALTYSLLHNFALMIDAGPVLAPVLIWQCTWRMAGSSLL